MAKRLSDLRPVYVVGIGLHRYQRPSDTPYVALGLAAVRSALADADLEWKAVESVFHANCMLGMAPTRVMLRHLGATGIPMQQVENASASGSTAFRNAVMDVASGISDVSLALGVDKPAPFTLASTKNGLDTLERDRVAAFTHFALLAQTYCAESGATAEDFARVAVKNHGNGAKNPFAQRQQSRTLSEILDAEPVAGFLTPLQCCPVGEGAAAVLVASEDAIRKYGLNRRRAPRVLSSTMRSERIYEPATGFDAALTEEAVTQAFAEAQIKPDELDVVELHDAFTVEELLYVERMGLCARGDAPRELRSGAFDIGGRVAVSASGGLLAMGHPLGPTGIGQIAEITRQLRGEAAGRQHPGAKTGLAHMVGVGAVCVVHILRNED
ncbi:MAG TPA: thiolase family protein [Steroidobacteraceae bacterium]